VREAEGHRSGSGAGDEDAGTDNESASVGVAQRPI
jgi:hypothetical protein